VRTLLRVFTMHGASLGRRWGDLQMWRAAKVRSIE